MKIFLELFGIVCFFISAIVFPIVIKKCYSYAEEKHSKKHLICATILSLVLDLGYVSLIITIFQSNLSDVMGTGLEAFATTVQNIATPLLYAAGTVVAVLIIAKAVEETRHYEENKEK